MTVRQTCPEMPNIPDMLAHRDRQYIPDKLNIPDGYDGFI